MDKAFLGGLCVGQMTIAFVLLGIYSYQMKILDRLEKMQLAVQELCDRIWERMHPAEAD